MNSNKVRAIILTSSCLLLFLIAACSNPGPAVSSAPSNNTNIVTPQPDEEYYPVKVQNGQVAPDFTLKDINGNTIKLSELKGKKVVLNMWWMGCHGCTDEMPYIQEFYDKYAGQGLVLIAVNLYEKESVVKSYVEQKHYTFTVAGNSTLKLPQSYTNWGVPTTFFIDEKGIVRARKDAGFISVKEIEDMYNSY
jgi:peroxiredoxin